MIDDTRAERAVEYIRDHADEYGEAKAKREYLEEFKKTKKALLMKEADVNGYATGVLQEREALANPEYKEILDGIQIARAAEESIRWKMVAAELTVDIWRTQESSKRMQIRSAT